MLPLFVGYVTGILAHPRIAREGPGGANPTPLPDIDHDVNG